jgi:hypothetical protein
MLSIVWWEVFLCLLIMYTQQLVLGCDLLVWSWEWLWVWKLGRWTVVWLGVVGVSGCHVGVVTLVKGLWPCVVCCESWDGVLWAVGMVGVVYGRSRLLQGLLVWGGSKSHVRWGNRWGRLYAGARW